MCFTPDHNFKCVNYVSYVQSCVTLMCEYHYTFEKRCQHLIF
jgi:hypothetical protein